MNTGVNAATLGDRASQARWILRIFYGFLLLFAMNDIPAFLRFYFQEGLDHLWPVIWLAPDWIPLGPAAGFILGGLLVTALGAAFFPGSRAWRVAVFVGLLQYLALKYSYGKIGHSMHLWLSVAAILIFLPRGWTEGNRASKPVQVRLLRVFALAQTFVLLTYTLSGTGKILLGLYQWVSPAYAYHSFHPQSLALHVSDRLLQTHSSSFFGELLVQFSLIGWPLFLGAIYLQFASLWIAWRPDLHRLWGAAIIGLHIGIAATMTIHFNEALFLVFLLLVLSPFHREGVLFIDRLRQLPGVPKRWRKVCAQSCE